MTRDGNHPMGLLADLRGVVRVAALALMTATAVHAQDAAPLILAPGATNRLAPQAEGGLRGFTTMDEPAPMAADLPSATLPVVVELFTSQGCSSCPPADAMLTMLARQPDVLALSYHVDYWDYLGWADSFARPEFTERQASYAHAVGERSVYTPQMIIEGQDTTVSPEPAQLMGLIDAHRFAPAMISVQRNPVEGGEAIRLIPLSDLGGRVAVLMVRYAPQRRVDVRAGENRGRSVTYSNVVLATERLTEWDGQQVLHLAVRQAQLDEPDFPDDTRHALLVQQMQGGRAQPGPILAAIRLD